MNSESFEDGIIRELSFLSDGEINGKPVLDDETVSYVLEAEYLCGRLDRKRYGIILDSIIKKEEFI